MTLEQKQNFDKALKFFIRSYMTNCGYKYDEEFEEVFNIIIETFKVEELKKRNNIKN